MSATRRFPRPDFSGGPTPKQIVENAFKPLDELIISERQRISAERSELLSSGDFDDETVDAEISARELNNQGGIDKVLSAPAVYQAMIALSHMKPHSIIREEPKEAFFHPEHMLLPATTQDAERVDFAPLLVFEHEPAFPDDEPMWTVCPMPFDMDGEKAWASIVDEVSDMRETSKPMVFGLAVGGREFVRFGGVTRGARGGLRFTEAETENLPVDITATMILEELARYSQTARKTGFSLDASGEARLKQLK